MSAPNYKNYINGEWVGGGKTFENRNPANTDEIVGLFSKGTAQDVADAAAAAGAAFPAWSAMPAPARGNLLYKAADIMDKKFDQLGAEMTREEGKTLPEAKGEVRRAINILRYFGGEGSRLPGMLVPSERDRVHMFAIRKPLKCQAPESCIVHRILRDWKLAARRSFQATLAHPAGDGR
jgi:acyl-CoA reductase-like NAD-dependent aldehyde dehydrogenase